MKLKTIKSIVISFLFWPLISQIVKDPDIVIDGVRIRFLTETCNYSVSIDVWKSEFGCILNIFQYLYMYLY